MILHSVGRVGVSTQVPVNCLMVGRPLAKLRAIWCLQQPSKAFPVRSRREFFTNPHFYQIPNKSRQNGQLAISHPRLYKKFENERVHDQLPAEWELIFSQGEFKMKLKSILWLSFCGLVACPFMAFYFWGDSEHEENVIFGTIEITKRTELFMFVAMNVVVFSTMYRTVRNIPLRIYFNENKNKYLLFAPSNAPWSIRKVEFNSSHVRVIKMWKLPSILKPWSNSEYLVDNKAYIFPHLFFRSGHDRYLMLGSRV